MRRLCSTVLVIVALAFYAGPAQAQEATAADADVSSAALVVDDRGPCTAVPDSIPGIFDFTDACASHDACYAAGEQTQATCDNQFRQAMNAACIAQHPSALDPARYACLFFAQLYYAGVVIFGHFFF